MYIVKDRIPLVAQFILVVHVQYVLPCLNQDCWLRHVHHLQFQLNIDNLEQSLYRDVYNRAKSLSVSFSELATSFCDASKFGYF